MDTGRCPDEVVGSSTKPEGPEFHGLCPWVNARRRYGMFRAWKPEYLVMEFIEQSTMLFGFRNIAAVS
jgi:hypothetical protein